MKKYGQLQTLKLMKSLKKKVTNSPKFYIMRDYYEILGVNKNADEASLKRAYGDSFNEVSP